MPEPVLQPAPVSTNSRRWRPMNSPRACTSGASAAGSGPADDFADISMRGALLGAAKAAIGHIADQAGLRDVAARGHAARQPHVAADGRALTDGDAPQDGGPGVNHHVVLDDRVARQAFFQLAVFARRETLGAQGHHLVEPYAVADDGGFADDHARAMVDEEALADGGARVDVDARVRVRDLGHDARKHGHAQPVQYAGQAVMDHRAYAGIAQQHFVYAVRRRVALISR